MTTKVNHIRGNHYEQLLTSARQGRVTLTDDTVDENTVIVTDRHGQRLGELKFYRGQLVSAHLGQHIIIPGHTMRPSGAIAKVQDIFEREPLREDLYARQAPAPSATERAEIDRFGIFDAQRFGEGE